MYASDVTGLLRQLMGELDNFEGIAKYLLPQPGEIPKLHGIDVWGGTLPLTGVVGGDHIIYIDFKQRFDLDARIKHAAEQRRPEIVENLRRCQQTAGLAVIDVSGHQATDALLAAMLHQAFLLGSLYELDISGQITKRLFENLNTRFYKSSGDNKFVSMIYGEISEDSHFRFLTAAQPFPSVFSNEHDRFMEVSPGLCVSFPPLGLMPSLGIDRSATESPLGFTDRYQMNEWTLMGAGDILLLHSDGLVEHGKTHDERYFPHHLERKLREVKHRGAREIFDAVREDLQIFADPSDDISIVVIKRT
jgi:serine phosphatase RsbU (regulator of sigma subunit)